MICDAFLSWKRDSRRHFLLLVRFSFISILPFYLKFSDSIKISGVYGIFQLKSSKLPILGYPLLDGRQSAPV